MAEKLAWVEYGAVLKFAPGGSFGAYHLKKSNTALFCWISILEWVSSLLGVVQQT